MVTFWAKNPHRNIVSELDLFKNKITNYASLVENRGLNLEETPRLDR